jgi:hypothetical protein
LKSGRETNLDQAEVTIMILEGSMEPGISDEALNQPGLDSRTIWRSVTDKEFKGMSLCGFWKKISKS